jgi:hypothetical protein
VPPLKTHLADLSAVFGSFRRSALRLDRHALFTLAIIATVAVGLGFSLPWPAAAKFVPHATAYAALFFAGLNLLTEIFTPGRSATPALHGALAAPAAAAPDLPAALFGERALRFFGWVVGFLVAGALVGLLPALFLFVLLQMRFEFGERWVHAIAASVVAAAAIYALFDRTFALPWPQALIGDIFPALRDASGLV